MDEDAALRAITARVYDSSRKTALHRPLRSTPVRSRPSRPKAPEGDAYFRPLGEWVREAACADADPQLFDDVVSDDEPLDTPRRIRRERAVTLCTSCPVRVECAREGATLDQRYRFGATVGTIWGARTRHLRRVAEALDKNPVAVRSATGVYLGRYWKTRQGNFKAERVNSRDYTRMTPLHGFPSAKAAAKWVLASPINVPPAPKPKPKPARKPPVKFAKPKPKPEPQRRSLKPSRPILESIKSLLDRGALTVAPDAPLLTRAEALELPVGSMVVWHRDRQRTGIKRREERRWVPSIPLTGDRREWIELHKK